MWRAPLQSLSYGAILVVCSYLIAFLAITFGNLVVLLALLSGFVFVGPMADPSDKQEHLHADQLTFSGQTQVSG